MSPEHAKRSLLPKLSAKFTLAYLNEYSLSSWLHVIGYPIIVLLWLHQISALILFYTSGGGDDESNTWWVTLGAALCG
jgi:hypothetical protein